MPECVMRALALSERRYRRWTGDASLGRRRLAHPGGMKAVSRGSNESASEYPRNPFPTHRAPEAAPEPRKLAELRSLATTFAPAKVNCSSRGQPLVVLRDSLDHSPHPPRRSRRCLDRRHEYEGDRSGIGHDRPRLEPGGNPFPASTPFAGANSRRARLLLRP